MRRRLVKWHLKQFFFPVILIIIVWFFLSRMMNVYNDKFSSGIGLARIQDILHWPSLGHGGRSSRHSFQKKSWYDYYFGEGSRTVKTPALKAEGSHFRLNGKIIRILSGSIHYFRIIPELWKDRLRKARAAGLNTIETYVPWNLHEPLPGKFDFQNILNIRAFLKLAMEEDLFVILRPGPYICSEWDFGGLPSWLLKDKKMRIRTYYKPYINAVDRYLTKFLSVVEDMQIHKNGPIIAIQIENEYGSYTNGSLLDKQYMNYLKEKLIKSGIKELLFTSDGIKLFGTIGAVKDVLMTTNFNSDILNNINALLYLQPSSPVLVMEYWSGWFDHWGYQHCKDNTKEFKSHLELMISLNASVNLYMFHGGTNFGFMAGANIVNSEYRSDVTSYDYCAPLSETGDYTLKYHIIRNIFTEVTNQFAPMVKHPDIPLIPQKFHYKATVPINEYLTFSDILTEAIKIQMFDPVSMEMLDYNDNYGQQYGYILYQTEVQLSMTNILILGEAHDRCDVYLDGKQIISSSGFSKFQFQVGAENLSAKDHKLDILVENCGRVNYGSEENFRQRKGILGTVRLNGLVLKNWQIQPLDFKPDYLKRLNLKTWTALKPSELPTLPGLFRSTFHIHSSGKPIGDTFLNMKEWKKGVVFINGFNLGRYWTIGPQLTLYIPGPLLKDGKNQILIFETYKFHPEITFGDEHILDYNTS